MINKIQWIGGIIFIILFFLLIFKVLPDLGEGIEKTEIKVGEYRCWNDTKVWSMYNGLKAEAFGITDKQMVNITYAYLYNYSIWTTGNIQDKFIEIPRHKCCYAIYNKNSEVGEWYCKEEIDILS